MFSHKEMPIISYHIQKLTQNGSHQSVRAKTTKLLEENISVTSGQAVIS